MIVHLYNIFCFGWGNVCGLRGRSRGGQPEHSWGGSGVGSSMWAGAQDGCAIGGGSGAVAMGWKF